MKAKIFQIEGFVMVGFFCSEEVVATSETDAREKFDAVARKSLNVDESLVDHLSVDVRTVKQVGEQVESTMPTFH